MLRICIIPVSTDLTKDVYAQYKYVQPSSVSYKAWIFGKFSCCELVQEFDLDQETDIESAEYKFPLDFNSALCDLTVETPREFIKGVLKEKQEAQKTFDNAKKEGRQVFLARESEYDPDICVLKLGNILSKDKLTITYKYISELSYAGSKGVCFIPTFVSPRYQGEHIPSPNHKLNASIVVHNILQTVQIPTPDITMNYDITNKSVTFNYSATGIIDKDIEILFNIDLEQCNYKFNEKNHTFVMSHFLPTLAFEKKETDDLVFIIDCSGSMEGDRIKNAAQAFLHCIKIMQSDKKNEYKFTIVRYGTTVRPVSYRLIKSSDNDKMKEMIELATNLKADLGGTETRSALEACLKLGKRALLITDGDTSDNENLRNLCKQFTVLNILGIGDGINRANIEAMSRLGHGICLFNQGSTDTTQNVETLFRALICPPIIDIKTNIVVPTQLPTMSLTDNSTPVVNNLKKNLQTNYPIVSGQFYTLYGLVDETPDIDKIIITGQNSQAVINQTCSFQEFPTNLSGFLPCLIAKRLIQHNPNLEKETIVQLATDFNVMTQHTSFVAVSEYKSDITPTVLPENNLIVNTMSMNKDCFDASMPLGIVHGLVPQSMTFSKQSSTLYKASASSTGTIVNNIRQFGAKVANAVTRNGSSGSYGSNDDDDDEYAQFSAIRSSRPKTYGASRASVASVASKTPAKPPVIVQKPTKQVSYDELIKLHFDQTSGLFKPSVKIALNVPDNFCTNTTILTLYVVCVVKLYYSDAQYQELINLVADNYTIADFNKFVTMDADQWPLFVTSKLNELTATKTSTSTSTNINIVKSSN